MTASYLPLAALITGLALATPARSAGPDDAALAAAAPTDDSLRQPLWEAGVFGVGGSQQAYPGARQQVRSGLVLPFLIYRGAVLRAEQGGVGVRALRTANTEVDVGFSGSFGSAASSNDARRGLPDIGTLIEFGPRLKWDLGPADIGTGTGTGTGTGAGRWRLAVPLRGVFDISDSFSFQGVAFEPELGWSSRTAGGWGYGASVSLLLGNRRLADTFYGVAPVYATATRPAYEARAGLIATRLAFNVSKRLAPDWRWFGYARIDTVAGAANRHSPLVDRTTGASAGIGLAWTWLRSDAAGAP